MSELTLENIEFEDLPGTDAGMSNFDHIIDVGLNEELISNPGKIACTYTGWNFCSYVIYLDGQFHAEVWTYGSPDQIVSADSLQEIMDIICDKYGSA